MGARELLDLTPCDLFSFIRGRTLWLIGDSIQQVPEVLCRTLRGLCRTLTGLTKVFCRALRGSTGRPAEEIFSE